MSLKQKTIATECGVSGVGLHTGAMVNLTFKPSEVGQIVFVRTDLGNAEIKAISANITSTARGTTIGVGEATVSTIEHVMAALSAHGISSAIIEIDGPECPILDGSSIEFYTILKKAGLKDLEGEQDVLTIDSNIEFIDEETGAEYLIVPSDSPRFTVMIDYGSKVLPPQHAVMHSFADFEAEIAPNRTFCFLHELELLLEHNLIKGGGLDNAIVFVEHPMDDAKQAKLAKQFNQSDIRATQSGTLNNTELRFVNEPARHKLLDLIGDLVLVNARINGHIIATKPGHGSNSRFGKFLTTLVKENRKPKAPKIDFNAVPLLDVNGIMAKLPHRPPFLFVDKIYELSEMHVIGVKNVTMNEYFFEGHFPGAPVMPGVLQIEAMAQVGGILVLNTVPDPENYLTYFLKIDGVKFRKMVFPGDTIVFRLDLLSPIRRGLCHMKGIAYVGNDLVMEAEMMAQIVKREAE
ncbi:MAG: bifunctional UDP-3-O-[3-hydroxymyristoyl] N-acetylglucosamine deacetylase/3-hydroxyacyl-ACP dehydratase [Flavobacteriales bacterium]|nr:bifunctional UDP-3-O-[3-hydroxymyristoyl] N-acetylglucosamine deacetylase/3-hydroxyacyl-ACP dehydratase [Flavobacteriales bacterium]